MCSLRGQRALGGQKKARLLEHANSVEAEGSIATAVARKSGRGVTVDKKSAFMMEVFRKFGMNIVGISETKWFGQDK